MGIDVAALEICDGEAPCAGILRGGRDVEGERDAGRPEPCFDGAAIPGRRVDAAVVLVEGVPVREGPVEVVCYEAAVWGGAVGCLERAGLG